MEVNKTKEYNQNYYKQHKNDKYHCDICNKDYSAFNRDQHNKTAKHIKNIKNPINNGDETMEKLIKFALSLGKRIEMKDNKLIIE
jgi:hypothetical protein